MQSMGQTQTFSDGSSQTTWQLEIPLRDGGVLGDLAPTLLELMRLPQPEEMTGASLLIRANAE